MSLRISFQIIFVKETAVNIPPFPDTAVEGQQLVPRFQDWSLLRPHSWASLWPKVKAVAGDLSSGLCPLSIIADRPLWEDDPSDLSLTLIC